MRYAARVLHVLLLASLLGPAAAHADQAVWVSRENARAAKVLIERGTSIRHFCAPCGNADYTEEVVRTVAVVYTGNTDW